MDKTRIKDIIIFIGAFSFLIMASMNFYSTESSVPAITELKRINGKISEYSCIRNSKHGDYFYFNFVGSSESVIMTKILIECNVLIPELKQNKFQIEVWIDKDETLKLGYAMLIDKKLYQSYALGTTSIGANILSLIMILVGLSMLLGLFNKRRMNKGNKRGR